MDLDNPKSRTNYRLLRFDWIRFEFIALLHNQGLPFRDLYHNVANFLYCSLSCRLLEETEDEVLHPHPLPLVFLCVTFSNRCFIFSAIWEDKRRVNTSRRCWQGSLPGSNQLLQFSWVQLKNLQSCFPWIKYPKTIESFLFQTLLLNVYTAPHILVKLFYRTRYSEVSLSQDVFLSEIFLEVVKLFSFY